MGKSYKIEGMLCVYCHEENVRNENKTKGLFRCKSCNRCFTKTSNPKRGLIIDNKKYCNRCNELKFLDDFYSNGKELRGECKDCYKFTNRLNNYGLDRGNFDHLLLSQNNKCAICSEDLESISKCFIDHNHENEIVRGILCPSCNTAIGLLKDSPEIINKAYSYVKRSYE